MSCDYFRLRSGGHSVVARRDASVLRDAALKMEHSDMSAALVLMELAKKVNPQGPAVRRKVDEYKNLLDES